MHEFYVDSTLIANKLRDKIYNTIPKFNLLQHASKNLILYNKQFSKWLESYVNDEYRFNKMFANDIFKIQKSEIQYIGKVDVPEIEDEELPF